MPYIKSRDRKRFDKKVRNIVAVLLSSNNTQEPVVGEVNYVISLLIWTLFEQNPSYTRGNNLMGVLECVKAEFYRRKLAPYEDKKIEENGDVKSLS